jgi:DNA-binding MarR family transcriptional regulator
MKKCYDPPIYYNGELTYVQVPRLIFNEPYEELDDDTRVLYGILLDRMEESYDNPERWSDNGEAFVYFQREELMQFFGIAQQKATRIFKTLETNNLIRRERQCAKRKSTKIFLNTYWENPQNEWEIPYREPRRNSFNGPKRRIHSFINIYWTLFKAPYDKLSNTDRIIYGLLTKRMEQDEKKGNLKTDKKGAYICYKAEKIMQTIHVADKTVTRSLNRLEECGLIRRERQGFGRLAKIRIMKPTPTTEQATPSMPRDEKYDSQQKNAPRDEKYDSPRDEKYDSPRDEKYDSTYKNLHFNNYSINQSTRQARKAAATSATPSESAVAVACEEMESQVAAQIDKQGLYTRYPQNKGTIDTIAGIMADELTSDRPAAKIGGATRARADIRARLLTVTAADVAAILDAMREHPPKITNPRGYLLTCLYNAPAIRIDKVDKQEKEKKNGESELWKYAHQLKREREKKKAAQAAKKDYVGDIMRERQEATKAAAQRLKEEME